MLTSSIGWRSHIVNVVLALVGTLFLSASAWAQYRPWLLICNPIGDEARRITVQMATLDDCIQRAQEIRDTYNVNLHAPNALVLRVFVHRDAALEAALTPHNLGRLAQQGRFTRLEVYRRTDLQHLSPAEAQAIQQQQTQRGGPYAAQVLTQAAPPGWTLAQAHDLRAAAFHMPLVPPHAAAAAAAAAVALPAVPPGAGAAAMPVGPADAAAAAAALPAIPAAALPAVPVAAPNVTAPAVGAPPLPPVPGMEAVAAVAAAARAPVRRPPPLRDFASPLPFKDLPPRPDGPAY